jgi:hypothetical protein
MSSSLFLHVVFVHIALVRFVFVRFVYLLVLGCFAFALVEMTLSVISLANAVR